MMEEKTTTDFRLSSPAFADSQMMPALYTCQGNEISPELAWENPPQGTKSLFLQMVDLDIPWPTCFTGSSLPIGWFIIFRLFIPACRQDYPEILTWRMGSCRE